MGAPDGARRRPAAGWSARRAGSHAAGHVVFIGHIGVPVGFTDLWRQLPARQTVKLHMWLVRAGEIPAGHDERIDWLFGWWRTLDNWVAGS